MFKGFIGQTVGVVCIPLWLGMTVYFMSRAATPNASDAGNWFIGFVLLTVLFIAIMVFWKRVFDQE
ncbi:MAG TPA: hypothetical protein VIJ28_23685 [Chloroflexota bacterium]|jgi:hypothetical protein